MRRSRDFVLKQVGGQDILVPVGAKVMDMNALVTLNATGRLIWEFLAEERSAEEVAAEVVRQFEADLETTRPEVLAFLDRLGRLGLLEK